MGGVSFGRLVERLYGSVSYALIYFVAGIAGGLASVGWDASVNSVGASGAIFGLLAALVAAQVHNDGSIPLNILRPLRNSSLIFTGCALLAGLLSGEVDNAAHLGGVAAGFILGWLLSRPTTGVRPTANESARRLGFAGMASVLLLGGGILAAKFASAHLTGENLYAATVHWFVTGEDGAVDRWNELVGLATVGKLNGGSYANRIEVEVIPFWKEADARLAKVGLPTTSGRYETLQFLKSITDDRLNAYLLIVQGLRKNDNTMVDESVAELQRVDERIKARTTDRT